VYEYLVLERIWTKRKKKDRKKKEQQAPQNISTLDQLKSPLRAAPHRKCQTVLEGRDIAPFGALQSPFSAAADSNGARGSASGGFPYILPVTIPMDRL
jgi:hypothetical protein